MSTQEYQVTVDSDGSEHWYQNGVLHRLDGPANEWSTGDKYWYQNDELHRLDGPAIEWSDGYKYWFIEGKELTGAEFIKRMNPVKEMTMTEIASALGYEIKIIK